MLSPIAERDIQSGTGVSVTIDGVTKYFGDTRAVGPVSLQVEPGEFLSLLGPSGSGKTTLLMMLAGFDQPSAGRLKIGQRDVTNLPPNKRDIGMVFQKYALFPHMTVAENVAYPLKMRKVAGTERVRRVNDALEMVKLQGYAERRTTQMSGGQQQRVALARAMVFNPPLILMDEPLGALDKKLRQHMQLEIKALQTRLGATVIYVTHDQEEALTMSDRIAVMNEGELVQVASPRALYDDPANPFVASFLGEMNFLSGKVEHVDANRVHVNINGHVMEAVPAAGHSLQVGNIAKVAIRPERVLVARPGDVGGLNAVIEQVIFNGSHVVLQLRVAGVSGFTAQLKSMDTGSDLVAGREVAINWHGSMAHAFKE